MIMKFGGTSVESSSAIERVAGIVRARLEHRPIVVVSAMGKTTNKLLAIAADAVAGRRAEAITQVAALRQFHLDEASQWGAADAIAEHFAELAELAGGLAALREMTPRSVDAISAFGERLSSLIVTRAFQHMGMNAVHADSRRYIVTDSRHTQAAPLYGPTYERLAALPRGEVTVMGGFIASTEEGVTSTLGRGGSDFTAAIVGAGVNASEIQIWTDVDGMLTCDPRIAPGGHRVKTISFAEAAELAYFGAKVLHPATVVPAIEKNIPVLILNSRRPEVEGTRIVAENVACDNAAKSIACKRDITIVNVGSTRMLMAHGFLRRIFEVFDRHETPVDMVTTSEVSVSLTIDNTARLDEVTAELRAFAHVEVESGQAIVCLVGDNMRYTPGVAKRIFGALEAVNIRMISQGASRLNVSFVVAERDLAKAVESLHREFFTELDPRVFD